MSMRKLFIVFMVLAFAGALSAVPYLTTIQDILYKADGTRFNGTINIQWNNFQAGDASIVATQSITLQIVNGVLKVQLVPTTNASAGANYQINYSSAGRFQFTETWAVPPSSLALRVRDVRISTGTTIGSQPVAGGQLQISDVQGLTNELLARPMRGVGYSPGRTAVINSAGQVDGAQGNLSDCVLVDGSSGPCGSAAGGSSVAYADAEDPQGLVNSSNLDFTLVNVPQPASSLLLYRNGLLMTNPTDYSIVNGFTIRFMALSAPQTGDLLTASYRFANAGPIIGNQTSLNAPEILCSGTGTTTGATSLAILGTCHVAANKLIAGDRVEIKFALTHQGTASGFSPAIYWGGTGLVLRAMNASDTAISGEASVMVGGDGSFAHFTSSVAAGGLPLMTSGAVAGSIQNISTIAFDGLIANTGTPDSVSLKFYSVTRYPAPQ